MKMSETLILNKHFIFLFLNTSKQQQKVLFETLTNNQILVVSEICYNLLKLDLDDKTQQIVKKRKKILQKISNHKLTLKNKKKIIIKHYKQLNDILLFIKDKLLELII